LVQRREFEEKLKLVIIIVLELISLGLVAR